MPRPTTAVANKNSDKPFMPARSPVGKPGVRKPKQPDNREFRKNMLGGSLAPLREDLFVRRNKEVRASANSDGISTGDIIKENSIVTFRPVVTDSHQLTQNIATLNQLFATRFFPTVAEIQKELDQIPGRHLVGKLPPMLQGGKKPEAETMAAIFDAVKRSLFPGTPLKSLNQEQLQVNLKATLKELGLIKSGLEVKRLGNGTIGEVYQIKMDDDPQKIFDIKNMFHRDQPNIYPNLNGRYSEATRMSLFQSSVPQSQFKPFYAADLDEGLHLAAHIDPKGEPPTEFVNLLANGWKYADNHAGNIFNNGWIVDHGGLVAIEEIMKDNRLQKFIQNLFQIETHQKRLEYLRSNKCPKEEKVKFHQFLKSGSVHADSTPQMLVYSQAFIDKVKTMSGKQKKEYISTKVSQAGDNIFLTENDHRLYEDLLEASK